MGRIQEGAEGRMGLSLQMLAVEGGASPRMVSRVLALGMWVNECWGHLLAQKNLCRQGILFRKTGM